jgi:hypothetical protein
VKNPTIVPENVKVLKKRNIQRLLTNKKNYLKKFHNNKVDKKLDETCAKLCKQWERPQKLIKTVLIITGRTRVGIFHS